MEKSYRFPCECRGHEIELSVYDDSPDVVFISAWERTGVGWISGFLHRIKLALKVLIKGEHTTGDWIIHNKTAKQMSDVLLEFSDSRGP